MSYLLLFRGPTTYSDQVCIMDWRGKVSYSLVSGFGIFGAARSYDQGA